MARNYYAEINLHIVWHTKGSAPLLVPKVEAIVHHYLRGRCINTTGVYIHEIGGNKAFQSAIDFTGERCASYTCPTQFGGAWNGDEGTPPGEPWAQSGGNGVNAVGDQFFDPAYTMSKRLLLPQPFSTSYCYNPYLGVPDGC